MATEDRASEATPSDNAPPAEWPRGVTLLQTLGTGNGTYRGAAIDRSGELVAACLENSVSVWTLRTGAVQELKGHESWTTSLAFNPQRPLLASGCNDKTIRLWDTQTGTLLHTLTGHQDTVRCVAFDRTGTLLASASDDKTVRLWDPKTGAHIRTLKGHTAYVIGVAFSPLSTTVASGGLDDVVIVWDVATGEQLRTLKGHTDSVYSVDFHPREPILASGSTDYTVKLWDPEQGRLLRTLEGHTSKLDTVAFSPDGRLMASRDGSGAVRVWNCETWEVVVVAPGSKGEQWLPSLSFHPTLPRLAAAGLQGGNGPVHLWELDVDQLWDRQAAVSGVTRAVQHTTAKVVLVGDHSVGKSGLGYRLIHGTFAPQSSTHGQQFWVFPALGKQRSDGTECEAILWDLAGQPDYRLVHTLFVDNADLALLVFDSSDLKDPLHGVGYWLKQLNAVPGRCRCILVAAQIDRGTCSLTPDELRAFCTTHGIEGPIATSAYTGEGIAELIDAMKSLVPWDDKSATVTTLSFKRIKDYVLGMKEDAANSHTIVSLGDLRARLEALDNTWQFTDAELLRALGHLENYGYIKRLRTSRGDDRILLRPEQLNNLASSFVLEARRNPKGLGALEEKRLLAGGYSFPELAGLREEERTTLLDSAASLFLEHNVCFRETDPLRMEPYLIFPELINLKKPRDDGDATEEGVAYTVTGPTEHVFAALVVLLGYTHTFTRTSQWQNNARYQVSDGLLCGFRQEAERDGELDLVLCFSPEVGSPVRTLFQGLFESFLARRNLTVTRYEPLRCTNAECGHVVERSVVRQRMKEGKTFTFCNECGEKLPLPKKAEPILLTREIRAEVETQHRSAEQRTRFEQAVFRLRAYLAEQSSKPLDCFISYAWGVPEHERWVEKRLAADLQKAGIEVVLDRWHNAQIGASLSRFVERVEECGRVIVVGTPLYRQKARNVASAKGNVVAAEWDVAGIRLLTSEDAKRTVLPVLLAGEESESFPALLRGRVYGDFRNEDSYFITAFDLMLSLHQIPPNHSAVIDLRDSLRGSEVS